MSQRSETRHKNDAMFSEGFRKGTDTDIYTYGVVSLKFMCTWYQLRRVWVCSLGGGYLNRRESLRQTNRCTVSFAFVGPL
jgi:hypothetical protein